MAVMTAAATAVSGAATATTNLSCSRAGSSGAQQLGGPRSVAVTVSRPSERGVKSKALAAFVPAGAAFGLHGGSKGDHGLRGSVIALDLNNLVDNVKKLSRNVPSSEGEDGTNAAVELAKRAAINAARDVASRDPDGKSSKLLDSVKELADHLPGLEGNEEAKNAIIDIAKHAAHLDSKHGGNNNYTASNLVEMAKTLSGKISGNQDAKNIAMDIIKHAAHLDSNHGNNNTNTINNLVEMAMTLSGKISGNEDAKNIAMDIIKHAARLDPNHGNNNSNTASNLIETVKSLSGKIPHKEEQNSAVDMAKGAAQNAASNAARGFADSILDKVTGHGKSDDTQ